MSRSPRTLLRQSFLLGCILLAVPSFVSAGSLVNGDFSAGLSGWTVTGDSVSVVGGEAVIQESSVLPEATLYQDFTISAGAKTLSFVLVRVGEEDGFPPAGFGVSLLDVGTGLSLVPTVDAFTDSFYTRDLTTGTAEGLAATGVTVSPSAGALPLTITVDISGLEGKDARILFRVFGGGSTSDASATIDDVRVGGANAVPEPGTLSLALMALTVLAGARRLALRSRPS
ncbi:PEP-CTERM sorting domain-containing protein [Aquisphaera insulae]|uniref:PEP-CTERM sorting domain-containing protein n=1 Tax=Aquisphaera insulae TaxID=2712864 RepID=UPI0013EA7AF0|nr:PEP-CTERM sorting domain-containing protein [Aquisphaera insulae]